MIKYIIRTSYQGWENGSGWTYGPDFYDEYEIKTDPNSFETESDLHYFEWLLDNIDITEYRFDIDENTYWIRELICIEPDPEYPETETIETVLKSARIWEKSLVWDHLPPYMTPDPRKKYYLPDTEYINDIFGPELPRCLDRKTVDRMAHEYARDTGETLKSFWDMFHTADNDEIHRFAVYNSND